MSLFLQLPWNLAVSVEFVDLTVKVKQTFKKETKEVLHGVSGNFRAGELVAIMGPSGAGKTTLLNVLTGFQNKGMGGMVLLNGRDRTTCHAEFRKKACYITQEDHLLPLFTTGELMTMAANLKLGNYSPKSKKILIDDMLDTLGLLSCRETRCEKLSGGQRKRLSIALELLNNPPAMFLDEPTTGLDSSSTMQCLKLLKTLAKGGRTVICTIHQPSANAFHLFDQVYVLAEGFCLYRGTPKGVLPFLSKNGFTCPQYHNPADYLLEIANKEYGDATSLLTECTQQQSNSYPPPLPVVVQNESSAVPLVRASSPTEWERFPVLIFRFAVLLHRDWTVTYLKVLMHILVGVTLGITYGQVGLDGSRVINNLSFLFGVMLYLSYTTVSPALLKFPDEVSILKKEWFNNWYKMRTYYVASIVATLPVHVVLCSIFCSICYFMTGQSNESWRFFLFVLVCILTVLTAEGIGHFVGSTFLHDMKKSMFVGATLLAFWMLFSGFLVILAHMPVALRWLSYLSFLRFGVEGLVLVTYGYGRGKVPCPPKEVYCYLSDSSRMLNELGMSDEYFWFDIGMLVLFFVILRLSTYVNLCRRINV